MYLPREIFDVARVTLNFEKNISELQVEHLSDVCSYEHPRVHGTSFCHRLCTFHVSVPRILVTVSRGELANIAMIAGGVHFLQLFYFWKKETPHSENTVCSCCASSGIVFDSARLKPVLCTAILAGATATPVQVRSGVAAVQRGGAEVVASCDCLTRVAVRASEFGSHTGRKTTLSHLMRTWSRKRNFSCAHGHPKRNPRMNT